MAAKPSTIRRRKAAPIRPRPSTVSPMTETAAEAETPPAAAAPLPGIAALDLMEAPAAAVLEKRAEPEAVPDAPMVAETVAETLRPYLKNFSDVLQVVMRVVEVTSDSYSAQAPHPGHLERLEAVSPGSAKAIIDMAIREQRSRLRIGLLSNLYPYIDLLLGFALAALCFTYGFLLGMAGHDQAGGAMIAISALGAIGWLIMTRLASRKGGRGQSTAGLAAQGGAD
jgi:uncharacterized membrane protein